MKTQKRISQLLIALSIVIISAQAHSICGDGILEDQEVLYGANGGGGQLSQLLILDPDTGSVLESIGDIGYAVTGLAVDPVTGELFGSTGGSDPSRPGVLISIDWVSGAGTVIGEIVPGASQPAADISFSPDGTLYGWQEASEDDLTIIDINTGEGTIVGNSGLSTYGSGLAASSNARLYFVGDGEDSVLSSIETATGQENAVIALSGGLGNGHAINALDINEEGVLFGVRNTGGGSPNELITINPDTGEITTVGPTDNRLDGIVFDNPGEVCDDGNTVDGDGCSADCLVAEEEEVVEEETEEPEEIEEQATPLTGDLSGGACALQAGATGSQSFLLFSLGLLLGLVVLRRQRLS